MAGVLLFNRDHVDEARSAAGHLPDALDAWNAGRFEVVPERSGPDISGARGALMECGQSGLHWRRTDDNWIVAVINRLHLQHRFRPRAGGVISGPLAERP